MKSKRNIIKIFVTIIIVLLIFFTYKLFLLNKYKSEAITIDTNNIFSEKLIINTNIEIEENEILTTKGLRLKNYFIDYKVNENNPSFKVKYSDDGNIQSFYSISSSKQYIEMLNLNSFKLYSDNKEHNLNFNTNTNMKLFLKNNNITNDVDLLKYIKNNYFIKNKITTSTNTIKNNYLINTFVEVALPEFKNIILITGNINGYLMNLKNLNTKEIHILKDDIQYIITLSGDEITNDEFIKELLSTVKFS